ncbi:hypothetical protein CQA77_16990 [Klebsiella pneumoniae]|nr:hypothetical protein CQA77_16990 [Klebsiella pneumoniae]
MSVNQYRRINFWTAILGQILSPFPAFFDDGRIYGKTRLAKFPDNRANRHIFILLFTPLLGIKRARGSLKKRTGHGPVVPLPAGLSSLYLQNLAAA